MTPEDEAVDYAIAAVDGAAIFPDELSAERMDQVATFLATRTFTRFVQEDNGVEEEGDDRLLALIHDAIAAAYVTGALDVQTQPNPTETVELSGKSGTPIVLNFYVN